MVNMYKRGLSVMVFQSFDKGFFILDKRGVWMEQRLQKLEERMDRVEDRQHTLETEQAETKVYIKQIFGILDELKITSKNQITKEDLFHFLSEQNKVNSKNLASWQKWTLTIIAGTLFVIVGYFFGH